MAADAPTTIHDLPDDMLYEIFGRVFESTCCQHTIYATAPPEGDHLALRSVCRRWRALADWARLVSADCQMDVCELANPATVRARHPTAIRMLTVDGLSAMDTFGLSLEHVDAAGALESLAPTLGRGLTGLNCLLCCPSLARIVPTVASCCSALSSLGLLWHQHKRKRSVPADVLAPLSALSALQQLELTSQTSKAAWPALPEAPRLSALLLVSTSSFVPVGSDAALGRLHALKLVVYTSRAALAAEDPFCLRAALDAGTWQPRRLTGLKELSAEILDRPDDWRPDGSGAPPRRRSPVGAEWAPLAGQVTELHVEVDVGQPVPPSTGIVAGLGALGPGLRNIVVTVQRDTEFGAGTFRPLDAARLSAPHLTTLMCNNGASSPVNAAALSSLNRLYVMSDVPRQSPIHMQSIAKLSSLKILELLGDADAPPTINLAAMFVDGRGLPTLEFLYIDNAVFEWDTTGLADVPTAAEFAATAKRLLPRLKAAALEEADGPGAQVDRSHVEHVLACSRYVLPAIEEVTGGRR